jgi:hypothetical protein
MRVRLLTVSAYPKTAIHIRIHGIIGFDNHICYPHVRIVDVGSFYPLTFSPLVNMIFHISNDVYIVSG